MDPEKKGIVPPQHGGGETNTEESRSFDNRQEAEAFYHTVRQRLLLVNGWHSLAGTGTATFQLTDASGLEADREAAPGDHFKIDIPGPGTITGEGFDWVQVEEVAEEKEGDCIYTAIRVRPATNPNNASPDVAHFFSEDATSSFMVRLEDNTVTAGVYGRNEKPNADAKAIIDKTRNVAVASGALAGASRLQWKNLTQGLMSDL